MGKDTIMGKATIHRFFMVDFQGPFNPLRIIKIEISTIVGNDWTLRRSPGVGWPVVDSGSKHVTANLYLF